MPILDSSSSTKNKDINKCKKCGQEEIHIYDRVESIAGRGEIARNEQFLLFPQCFKPLPHNDTF